MIDRRPLAVVVGLLAAFAGLVLTVAPIAGDGVGPRLGILTLIVVVSGLALRVIVRNRSTAGSEEVTLPTPESRPAYQAPHADFADLLTSVNLVGRRNLDGPEETPRERLDTMLHDVAVDVLGETDGWSPRTAADRLSDGTWADDESATAFFAGSMRPPISYRAYLPFGDYDLPYAERARHVVCTLADRLGKTTPDPDATADRPSPPDTGPYWPTEEVPTVRSTSLVRYLVAAVLAVSAVGVAFGRPGVVLTATLGLAIVGVARIRSPAATVELSRSLSTASPAPGDYVTVTVTVRNTGESTLPDIRLVDGVPPGLRVVDGSPRFTTALRPGKAATTTYTVAAIEGTHRFEPGLFVLGDGIGTTEKVTTIEPVDGPTELECPPDPPSSPSESLREQVTANPGRHTGNATGAGVEFDALREYRPGDPPARIDWRHRAKTGELATIEFREPRVVKTVILVDTRPAAYVADGANNIPAPRYGAIAGFTIASQLLAEGIPVGFGTTSLPNHWLSPAIGPDQRVALRERVVTGDAVPWLPPVDVPDMAEVISELTARLAPDEQVIFVSPCCDDPAVDLARTIDVEGNDVSVVSPDCTDPTTIEGMYGHLSRLQRLAALREAGIPVRDWAPQTDLEGVRYAID